MWSTRRHPAASIAHVTPWTAKTDLAWQRLVALEAECNAYWQNHPIGFRHEVAPASPVELAQLDDQSHPPDFPFTGRRTDLLAYRTFLRFSEPPPLEIWSAMLGEVLHGLRSSLDVLLYSLAVNDSGTDPPPQAKDLKFPICLTPADFTKSKSKLKALSALSLHRIHAVQPFSTVQHFWGLEVLRRLNNADKHTRIDVYAIQPSGFEMSATSIEGGYAPPTLLNLGALTDGGWLATTLSPVPVDQASICLKVHMAVVDVPTPGAGSEQADLGRLMRHVGGATVHATAMVLGTEPAKVLGPSPT